MANKCVSRDYYELRRGGEVLCSSSVPNLGYPAEVLWEMVRAGYGLYRNGNRVKLCDITAT